MAQIAYRGNLSVKQFPLLTDFQGRTVIIPGPDNTFNRSLTSSEDADKDVGLPIAYYMHNVLPAPYGFSSVGYDTVITGTDLRIHRSIKVIRSNPYLAGGIGLKLYFIPFDNGTYNVLALETIIYANGTTTVPGVTVNTKITYATVQGITYIYYSNIGCYKYNAVTAALIPVTLTGLNPTAINGITTFQGYLIAYDRQSVYWSSTLDIDYTLNSIDFVPSLLTGAGQIKPEGAKSDITVVAPATFGFAVYTASNIVSAVYSGNSRFPFNFREVVASGGCGSLDLVSYDSNTGNQYAYTTSGLQTVSATSTQTVFPEVTDFLAGRDFEDFNEVTQKFVQLTLTLPMAKKITSIADRYLVISYGIITLTHAIVFDMAQKRFGKLKIDHVDCFELEYESPEQTDAPRRSLAFLTAKGTIKLVNPSITNSQSSGVILLGKFQYVRSRLITLEELIIQTVHPNQSIAAYDLYSETGGTLESTNRIQGYETSISGQSQRVYKFHKTATNHSILLIGGFFLASIAMLFHVHGRR
jgi:hypothetical protein